MDEIRGFAVFCMVFYHAFYSMGFLFSIDIGTKLLNVFMGFEPFFAGAFILISGISSQLSHSNVKRGLMLAGVSILITGVTFWFIREQLILFGILHLLSVCILLFASLKKLLQKVPVLLGLTINIFMFVLTLNVEGGVIGLGNIWSVSIPKVLFSYPALYPFGIYHIKTYCSDYFPLLPWMFVFFLGTFLGRYALKGMFPKFMYKSRAPFFSWLGTHALPIYIFHQPIIYVLLAAGKCIFNN